MAYLLCTAHAAAALTRHTGAGGNEIPLPTVDLPLLRPGMSMLSITSSLCHREEAWQRHVERDDARHGTEHKVSALSDEESVIVAGFVRRKRRARTTLRQKKLTRLTNHTEARCVSVHRCCKWWRDPNGQDAQCAGNNDCFGSGLGAPARRRCTSRFLFPRSYSIIPEGGRRTGAAGHWPS